MNFRMKFGRILTRLKAKSGKLASTIILSFILALVLPGDAWKVRVEYRSTKAKVKRRSQKDFIPRLTEKGELVPLVIGLPFLNPGRIPETYRAYAYATMNEKSDGVRPFELANPFPTAVAVAVYLRNDCNRLPDGENALQVKCADTTFWLKVVNDGRAPKVQAKAVTHSKPPHAPLKQLLEWGGPSSEDSQKRLLQRMKDPKDRIFGSIAPPASSSGTPSFSNVDVPAPTVSPRKPNVAKTKQVPVTLQANGSTASDRGKSEEDRFLDKALGGPGMSEEVQHKVRKSFTGLPDDVKQRLREAYNALAGSKKKIFGDVVLSFAAELEKAQYTLTPAELEARALLIVKKALADASAEYAKQSKPSRQKVRGRAEAGGALQPIPVNG